MFKGKLHLINISKKAFPRKTCNGHKRASEIDLLINKEKKKKEGKNGRKKAA